MTSVTTIETPERVAFTYDLAGLGTRAIAYLIDLGIRGVALLVLMVAVVAIFGQMPEGLPSWLPTAGIVLFFVMQWGYLALFEGLWSGQTPGKRIMGIRVIKDGGYPASFADAALRNVIRVVDFLPAFYGVGIVTIFFTNRHQRLGDIVAGTLVVRQSQRRPPSLDQILNAHRQADLSPQARAARLELPVAHFEAIVEFLERAEQLDPASRERVAEKFAATIRPMIAASRVLRERYPLEGLSAEGLLRAIVGDWSDESGPDGEDGGGEAEGEAGGEEDRP